MSSFPLYLVRRRGLTIQWHITPRCDYICEHCYIWDPTTYAKEIERELPLEECLRICKDIISIQKSKRIPISVNLTGGHPLLRKDLFEIMKSLHQEGIRIGILGNPTLLSSSTLEKLVEHGLEMYQVSIDGLEKTHERLRNKKGSYKLAFEAIKEINNWGITSEVMSTVSKFNANDMPKLAEEVGRASVSIYAFDRLVPIGKGKKMQEYMFKPHEYRDFLLTMFNKFVECKNKGYATYYSLKDMLWNPLRYELGLIREPRYKDKIISGCAVGINILCILADGTVLPCRRLPLEIGKVPEQKLWDIFIDSKELNELRNYDAIEGCGECKLLLTCRGNRCVAYGFEGDYFAEDPCCWWNK